MDSLIVYEQELNNNTKKYKSICEQYGDTKQIYEAFDDLKKTRLAQCKEKYKGSNADVTDKALADDEYIEFLEELAKVRKVFYNINMKREAYLNRINALITLLSTQKELMKMR